MAAAGLFFCLGVLWLRVGWIQIVCHATYAERAAHNHVTRVLLPPVRGQLLDRYGRPLARDLITYSVSAAPREMKHPRRTARELAGMLGESRRALDRSFAARKRYLWVARHVPPEIGQAVAERGFTGVYVSTETRREYMLGDVACEIVGRTNTDNVGVDGLELQLDDELRGQAGWETLFRDGAGRTVALERGLKRAPVNGNDVVLTLDSELQSIVEGHLARAVKECQATRGFALFLDPRTGEILATADVPHLPPGKARNWTFTDQFEPGSTFKVVVAGAVLEEGVLHPNDLIEASETGEALVAPGARFHDEHRQAYFKFRDAVRWSSNIAMGRTAMMLGPDRLYEYATDLGFGSLTGVNFPGEASGTLRSPEHWSLRSCPTIAIGYEVSVTPLQMALAYAAVANGGVLMHPMLVREVRDPSARTVRHYRPHASHRVFSEHTAATLGTMFAAVVDSGTGHEAHIDGLHVAGKTGTARKFDPHSGYGRRAYMSSFVGYVPADRPCLVGIVVIDNPKGRYYGGAVAAPVFRDIVQDVSRLPEGPLGPQSLEVAARPPAPAPVVVPDLRLLLESGVVHRLAALGLRARVRGDGPRVLDQDPEPGRAVERGSSVTVWMSAPSDSEETLPDLTGLAVREALRRLTRLGIEARIEGSGVVTRQSPAAGTALPISGSCRLWCAPERTADGRKTRAAEGGTAATNGREGREAA